MKGPFDGSAASDAPREAPNANFPRPPGGKALMRLLTLLASKGYAELADAVIENASIGSARESLLSRVAKFPSSERSLKGGAAAQAEYVAREFLKAAQPPGPPAGGPPAGPPNPALPQWEPLGPYTIPNGQTYGSSRVSVSGRVSAIAVDPSDSNHVLCGGANAGVWESFNGGASWAPRTDYQATTTVGAITFDPSNPATVYCGTGEGNWWSWLGVGVLQSNDGATPGPLCAPTPLWAWVFLI